MPTMPQRQQAKHQSKTPGIMFAGFRDVDPSDQSSSAGNSPASSGGSSRFGSGPAKARMQDKEIEKGRSIMMRDYVSA